MNCSLICSNVATVAGLFHTMILRSPATSADPAAGAAAGAAGWGAAGAQAASSPNTIRHNVRVVEDSFHLAASP